MNWLSILEWSPLLIVSAFFAQTTIHEFAHAFVALLQKRGIDSIKIWPHKEDPDGTGPKPEMFWFGRVKYIHPAPPEYKYNKYTVALRKLMPVIITLPGWILGLVFILPWWLNFFWVAGIVDMVRGSAQPLWRKERGDWNRAFYHLGNPLLGKILGGMFAITIIGVSLFRVISEFI